MEKPISLSGPGTPRGPKGMAGKKAPKPMGLDMPAPIATALPNLKGSGKAAPAPMGLEMPAAVPPCGASPVEPKKWTKKGYTLTGSILQDFGPK